MERRADDHSGHRQRLLQKLERTGDLTEHERLEILLFYVFKRRNTNDLAHRLLAEFGSLKNLSKAGIADLQRVEGIGRQAALFLYVLGRTHQTMGETATIQTAVWENYDAEKFVASVRPHYVGLKSEVLDFYLLDVGGNVYLRRRFRGEKDNVTIDPSIFTRMILDNDPSGIIAVHNHPSGSPIPSSHDEEMTRLCQMVCSFHNVLFCDHLILTEQSSYSYYRTGKMQELCRKYSVKNMQEEQAVAYQDEKQWGLPNVFKKDFDKLIIERRGDKYVGIIKEEV